MRSLYRTMAVALTLVAALSRCDSAGMSGTSSTLDLSPPPDPTQPPGPDMTVSPSPDLAMVVPPTITSITPASAVNTGGGVLTIKGTGFAAGAKVTVAGAACLTLSAMTSQLTCTIPARAATCGPVPVVVTNPDQGAATDQTAFSYRAARRGFTTRLDVPNGGSYSRTVVVADFNNDGKLDVANTNWNVNSLSVRNGNGDGTFGKLTTIDFAAPVGPIAVGDFNGDGNRDLALLLGTRNQLVILLGNGDGTFQSTVPPLTAGGLTSLVVGDVNNDKKTDILVADGGIPGVAVIWLGNNDGTFRAASPPTVAVGELPEMMDLHDTNGDGKLDLIVLNTHANNIGVLLGNNDGTFGEMSPFSVGMRPLGMVVADVNGDNQVDTINTNIDSNSVSVRLGDGMGGMGGSTPNSTLFVGHEPMPVDVGDFDGDGAIDIVVGNFLDRAITVLSGKGDGTFPTSETFVVTSQISSVVVADFDGDKRPDLIAASTDTTSLALLLNKCQ